MIRNYFVVAFRNFWRNKLFSAIHILGLSIGISASVVIFLIVRHELSFDNFEKDDERIYRIVMDFKFSGMEGHGSAIPAPVANALDNEATGIDLVVPVMKFQGDGTVSVIVSPDRSSNPLTIKKQRGVVFTNEDYFKLLSFNWIIGSPEKAISEPFSVVLTESRAKEYFPDIEPASIVGKQITYNNDLKTTVTGIVRDLTENSDFNSVEFISYSTISKTSLQHDFMMDQWKDWMAYSSAFVKLSSSNDKTGAEKQLNALLKKYDPSANPDEKTTRSFALQPLADVHFDSTYIGFDQRIAHKPTLYGLTAIAAFILLLGCINFTNLTTAQASKRAKEIGIRKTIGSSKKQLVFQFLSETFSITSLATILSISLTPILLSLFSDFMPPGIEFSPFTSPMLLTFLLGLIVFVSFLSGFYPAMILSGFRPIVVLRDRAFAGSATRSAGLRKLLTVSQFIIAQFFVIAAFMVSKQIHFSINQDLGYKKDAILNFEAPFRSDADHRTSLLNEIRTIPEIQMATVGFLPPAMEGAAFSNISYNQGKEPVDVRVQIRWGEPEYISLYNIEIVAGRNVRSGENISEVLINEEYAKELGFQNVNEALGIELNMGGESKATVVGVMKDFHEGTAHMPMGAVVFKTGEGSFFHVALPNSAQARAQWPGTIRKIEQAFKTVYPEGEFTYKFFDDTIANFYTREQNTSRLLNWAMGISILISCMGLLGLVMFTAETKIKEIGIRKIFGATVVSIVKLLSIDFIRLILIAFVIAAPVAWYAVDNWLNSFAYRTTMSWWVFALSGVGLIGVAVLTLGAQLIKTATQSPAKSLRSE